MPLSVSKRMLKAEGQSRHRLTLHAARPDLLPSLLSRFDAAAELVIRCHRRSIIDVDDALILIGKLCGDRIKELVLIGVDVTCAGIEWVAWKCKKLERLTLCGSKTNIGDEEISCIAAQCVGLKKVCIKGCPVTNQGIKAFAFGCPNLVEIKVDKCKGVTSEVVDWLGARRKFLAVNLDVGEIGAGGFELDSESDGDGDGGGGGGGGDVGGGDDGGGLQGNGVDIPPNLASHQVFRSRFGVFEGRSLASLVSLAGVFYVLLKHTSLKQLTSLSSVLMQFEAMVITFAVPLETKINSWPGLLPWLVSCLGFLNHFGPLLFLIVSSRALVLTFDRQLPSAKLSCEKFDLVLREV
ncbi:hypothetical protein C3L33_12803, partial [Rhododendron williamsianum]